MAYLWFFLGWDIFVIVITVTKKNHAFFGFNVTVPLTNEKIMIRTRVRISNIHTTRKCNTIITIEKWLLKKNELEGLSCTSIHVSHVVSISITRCTGSYGENVETSVEQNAFCAYYGRNEIVRLRVLRACGPLIGRGTQNSIISRMDSAHPCFTVTLLSERRLANGYQDRKHD